MVRRTKAAPEASTASSPSCRPDLRWREWMGRVKAAIFAFAEPEFGTRS